MDLPRQTQCTRAGSAAEDGRTSVSSRRYDIGIGYPSYTRTMVWVRTRRNGEGAERGRRKEMLALLGGIRVVLLKLSLCGVPSVKPRRHSECPRRRGRQRHILQADVPAVLQRTTMTWYNSYIVFSRITGSGFLTPIE